jgi:hypothetical protein
VTLKGITLAEKLRLAQEAGVNLPHYTNTDNPIDFPKVANTMNKKLRQFERESGLDIFGLGAKRVKWEAALEKYAELIVRECMDICYRTDTEYEGHKVKSTVIASKVAEHFGVEE